MPDGLPQLRSAPAVFAWVVGAALTTLAVAWFVATTHRVLLWLLVAGVLAMALDHLVEPLSRVIPRTAACVAAFFAGLGAMVGAIYLVVTLIVDQVTALIRALPGILDDLAQGEGPVGFIEREFQVVDRARQLSDDVTAGRIADLGGGLVAIATDAASFALALVSIAFLTLFLLIYGPRLRDAAIEHLPEDRRQLARRIARESRRAAGGWVIGAVIVAIPATLSAFLVLELLGAPYTVALASVVMIANPLPFVGTALASTVVGLVLLGEMGLTPALVFVGFMIAYNQLVENHLLVPLVYGNTVRLSPLGVLVAVLLGAHVAGIPGALLAIPVSGALKVAVVETLRWRSSREAERRRPGDELARPPDTSARDAADVEDRAEVIREQAPARSAPGR